MKAYIVGLKSNPDVGNGIVFAKNGKEARKKADGLDLTDTRESYIDVTVHRYAVFDDMENLSERDLMKEQWKQGWWCHQRDCPFFENQSDDVFYKWYDRVYK